MSLAGCNSPDSNNVNSIDNTITSFSTNSRNEGDETNNREINRKNNNLSISNLRLPAIPLVPVFAAFNNDYKTTFAENEPIAHADPNNPDKYLYTLLESAKTTIDAAIYDIKDPGAVNEFIVAAKRGVKIRFVTDGHNLSEPVNADDAASPMQARQGIQAMKDAGIKFVDSGTRRGLMHNKFIVVDNSKVWTGSYNLSSFGMYRDNQNIVWINSAKMADNYTAEFNRLFSGNFDNTPALQIPNPVINVGDVNIQTFFSPNGGTLQGIMNELKTATKVKFMAFSFTSSDIGDQMVAISKKAGGQVEGVYDECEASNSSEQLVLNNFKSSGKIWMHSDGNQALLHHKVIILDDKTVITGSFNFSKNAELNNDENTVIIKSPAVAKLYLDEYARVKQAAINNKNIPPYDHPACKH